MRIVYSLIVSGVLLINGVPANQNSPPDLVAETATPYVAVSSNDLVFTNYPNSSPNKQISDPTPIPLADAGLAASRASTVDLKVTPPAIAKNPNEAEALATYGQLSPLPISGYAMFYNPNVMQTVLNYRLEMGQVNKCAECIGNVALLRAGDLNRHVWLQWGDGTVDGPYLVVDAAAQHHVGQLLARQWVVDVDNRTAVRRGMAGPVPVTVWGAPPAGITTAPPFAPLYSTMPVAAQPPGIASTSASSMTPVTTLAVTPVPTVTPLPFIGSTPSIAAPTAIPFITAPPPVVNGGASPTAVVTQRGFPTDTPVPTITPLPFITSSTTQASMATATPFPTATLQPAQPPTATMTPTVMPTVTALPPVNSTSPPSAVVIQRGFPTDTPTPTITPLPFITTAPPTPTGPSN